MNKYQILHACGEGFYGTVFKSRHKQSDTLVAIKQFKQKEDYATKREIETLSKLKHPNIINLREVFREQGKLHMVFEFLDTDLLNALDKYPKGMPEKLVRIYMTQLCRALEYCHQRGVVHRDLKPENLLVSGNVANPDPKRSLKLCDFGEARDVGPADKFLSGIIGTRWYRAPEILIGAKVATASKSNDASSFNKVTRPKLLRYDFQVDLWGAGCIMGELLLANPMFPADTDIQQLEMVQVYGTPAQLTKRFNGKCSAICLSGLKGLLELSPHKRLTARTALQHQFFGKKSSGGGGGGGSLIDSFSPGRQSHPRFKPQFSHSEGLGDLDEEIDTESDDDGQSLSDDFEEAMPEDDYDDYDDYNEQPAANSSAAVAQPALDAVDAPADAADNYDDGYSDDEFEDGYSDDEFDDPEVEEAHKGKKTEHAGHKHHAGHHKDHGGTHHKPHHKGHHDSSHKEHGGKHKDHKDHKDHNKHARKGSKEHKEHKAPKESIESKTQSSRAPDKKKQRQKKQPTAQSGAARPPKPKPASSKSAVKPASKSTSRSAAAVGRTGSRSSQRSAGSRHSRRSTKGAAKKAPAASSKKTTSSSKSGQASKKSNGASNNNNSSTHADKNRKRDRGSDKSKKRGEKPSKEVIKPAPTQTKKRGNARSKKLTTKSRSTRRVK